ncbi:1-phosphofructokinase/tagatose 6-phosphate kinase [Agromyces sp. CF514]|uniref:1-phosphofructokinase family hexose kinase n=1 Tax=Agromyces sp. CF514 TaxID=1881031 RepID=UPI0008DF8974|nr:PfkB family carbohydrate kinase [Agromyces sp. CF514]SFR71426.1 1-phosphofructokinase/tagatose 6-phosphate kinase [Agromyces sp. CF514]
MIVALALSPSLDVTYEVDALAVGDITRPTAVTRVAGGKALNVARSAAALGADVLAVAALGGPTGEWVGDLLAADGLAVEPVELAATTRTCLAIVESRASATSTDVYEQATALTAAEWSAYVSVVRAVAAARPGAWFALSGSIPPGVPLDELAELLGALRAGGAHVAVDGSGAGLRATVGGADLVKVNRSEAAELLGSDLPDAETAAAAVRARYGVAAIVTDGVNGAWASAPDHDGPAPAPQAIGRFPAGSGDSFLGGLLAALDRGDPLSTALELAADAAERNARVPGQAILG